MDRQIKKWDPDGVAAQQYAEAGAEIATLLLKGSYGGIDYMLEILDSAPDWENAATFIGFLGGAQNLSNWGIGEILYFLRHKTYHTTVAEWDWNEGDDWPDGLFEYIQNRYQISLAAALSDPELVIADILGWKVYKHHLFWLLAGKGYIRIWHDEGKPAPTDDEWGSAIEKTFKQLTVQLNATTARAYYAAVATYPSRNDRIEGVAWTTHLEMRNYKADEVDDGLSGDERHEAIRRLAVPALQEFHDRGEATVQAIRDEIATKTQKKKGYVWELPHIDHLWVLDPETGEYEEAIEIYYDAWVVYFLYHTRLVRRDRPEVKRPIWDEETGDLWDEKGTEIVARFINRDIEANRRAEQGLAQAMKWRIKGREDL